MASVTRFLGPFFVQHSFMGPIWIVKLLIYVKMFFRYTVCIGKFHSILPLLPCTWTCFIVWGKKRHPPTPLHLGVCTIRQLTDQSVGVRSFWNLVRQSSTLFWWGLTTPTAHACKRLHIHQPKKLPMSKSVYYSFYPHGGWAGQHFWICLEFSQLADSWFARLPRTSVVFTCRHYLMDYCKSTDRNRSVLFPAKYKTKSQFRLLTLKKIN